MNVEDKITYIVLKDLARHSMKNLSLYRQVMKKVKQVDPSSTHIVADTLKLIDQHHNQFLNCVIKLKNQITPVPEIGTHDDQPWVTRIGRLELKRLENDYQN